MPVSERELLRALKQILTPINPIQTRELLYGRSKELDDIIDCLDVGGGIPFVFGNRGVGKTSLAQTAAQEYCGSNRDPIYVACSEGATALMLLRDVAISLSEQARVLDKGIFKNVSAEVHLGLSPSVKFATKVAQDEDLTFGDANEAVRVIKGFDSLIKDSQHTVVVIDELDQMEPDSKKDLAFFVKQLGDQRIETKFILVGIADNVHELIGAHQSVPRYLRNIELGPLRPQELIDIVQHAADEFKVKVPVDILYRISIIGNGYPHFAHLIGLAILVEAITHGASAIDDALYRNALDRAVRQSIEQLRASYDDATQRGSDDYRNVIWTMADMDGVDLRSDQVAEHYVDMAKRLHWEQLFEPQIGRILSMLKGEPYGEIVMAPGKRYGATKKSERRYRYHRFRNNLMRGYVRLRAESEGFQLGRKPNL